MAGIPTQVIENAREQVLSSDINRVSNLAGRELMDAAQSRSVRADFYAPASNSFDDFTVGAKAAQAIPLAGLTRPPSLDGITSVFDMAIGAGEAQLPGTPSSVDISGYQLLRWPAQTLTWPAGGTPNPSDPLICLVVATPADALTDLQSRNILVDPVARTVAPANVYKTTNPVATLSVVAGTAAAAPVAPAVPAGALALFEVYVPPLASDSTAFLPVRRAWRQIEFPGTSQHGIVKGGVPVLNTTATPALVSLAAAPSSVHRIVIDGELLSFGGMFINPAQPDSINPPVASGHANFDAPAYLYLCGGRNQPLLNYSSLVPGVYSPLPVALIISLTPPDALGFPTASLATATPTRTFPRAACCYVGLCFCAAGATTNVPAFYAGDFIYSAKTVPTANLKGFLLPGLGATNAFAAYTFAGQPAVSDVVDLSVAYATVPADQGIFSTSSTSAGQFARFLFTNDIGYSVGNKLAINANPFQIYIMSAGGNGTMYVVPAGYNMNVPRLGR